MESRKQNPMAWLHSAPVGQLNTPAWSAKRGVMSIRPVSFGVSAEDEQSVQSPENEQVQEQVAPTAALAESSNDRKETADVQIQKEQEPQGDSGKKEKETLAQAYQRGLQDGKALAEEQIRSQLEKEYDDKVLDSTRRLGSLLGQIRRESKTIIIDLATAMASKVIDRNLQRDDDWIMHNIQSSLDRRVPNGPMRLRLNPKIRDMLLAMDPAPIWMEEMTPEGPAIKLVADVNMEPGDCILESDRMRIDARLDVQVDRVRQIVESTLAGVLFMEDS